MIHLAKALAYPIELKEKAFGYTHKEHKSSWQPFGPSPLVQLCLRKSHKRRDCLHNQVIRKMIGERRGNVILQKRLAIVLRNHRSRRLLT